MQTDNSKYGKRDAGNLLEELIEAGDGFSVAPSEISGARVGRIETVTFDDIRVEYPDNPHGALSARATVKISADDAGKEALLLFENSDPKLPIVIGLMNDQKPEFDEYILNKDDNTKIIKDGDRIVFDAEKEIELRCGTSSILMKKDGKIVIKGREIISRARETNKVRGASVLLN